MVVATNTVWRRFDAYVDGVLLGAIRVGRFVRLAVERHVADLLREDVWFDRAAASRAVQFVECLSHSKGKRWAGKPFVLSPWQIFCVASLFGWKRHDGRRRFRIAYVEVARKNGKSTLAAALGHLLFVGDGEKVPEVFTAATKLDQARIVWEEATRMCRQSPALRRRIAVQRDKMVLPEGGKFEPLGENYDTLDGLSPSGAILDEMHAHKTRVCWDKIETGMGARENPLLLAITTAGEGNQHETIGWENHDFGCKILESILPDDSWFVYIAALDDGDDWTDISQWCKANPNLNVSIQLDDLVAKLAKAQSSPAAGTAFQRYHLNLWVGSDNPWLASEAWAATAGGRWYGANGLQPEILEEFRGRRCYVGADLSSVSDLTAFVFCFPWNDGTYRLLPLFWCPRVNAEGRQRNRRIPYLEWARLGLLKLTDKAGVDYEIVRQDVRKARDEWGFDICEIAMDPHNAQYLLTSLDGDGFTVFKHPQGMVAMNDPVKQTERLIAEQLLHHGGQAVLAWNVSNVTPYDDGNGNRKLDKKRSADKIDGAVAMAMAVGRAVLDDEGCVYAHRGPLYAGDLCAAL